MSCLSRVISSVAIAKMTARNTAGFSREPTESSLPQGLAHLRMSCSPTPSYLGGRMLSRPPATTVCLQGAISYPCLGAVPRHTLHGKRSRASHRWRCKCHKTSTPPQTPTALEKSPQAASSKDYEVQPRLQNRDNIDCSSQWPRLKADTTPAMMQA